MTQDLIAMGAIFHINRQEETVNTFIGNCYYKYKANAITVLTRKYGLSENEANGFFVDALIILKEKLDKGDLVHTRYIKTYLIGIMKNLYRNQMKKKNTAQERESILIQLHYDSHQENEVQEIINMDYLLNKLTSKHKKILKMFYLQGLSQKEIAEELGYGNAAVVKNMKFRALQKCRVMYFNGLCSMGRDPLG